MTVTCSQCKQAFNLMITFQCGHTLCLHCFQSIPCPTLPVKCIKCDQTTHHFRYKLQTVLKCDHCSQEKAVEEFWWCDKCHDTACSFCAMQTHKGCETTMWEDMHAWKFFVEASHDKLSTLQSLYKKGIDDYIDEIRTKLHKEIDNYVQVERSNLDADDAMVSNTLKISNKEKMNSVTSSAEIEKQRLRCKQHLTNVLDGFRFEGKKVNLNIKAIKFISGDIQKWCFQEINIDNA